MTAAGIAKALCATRRSGTWWRCRCPVHGSAGASLAVRDGERGLIVRCWAGCQSRDVLAALRSRGLLCAEADGNETPHDPEAEQRRREAETARRQQKINLARDMWRCSLPAAGTVVERYLRSRKIT